MPASVTPPGSTKAVLVEAVALNGGIDIRIVDESGRPEPGGSLLHIFNDGSLYRYGSIHKRFGLKLDGQQQLVQRF